MSDFCSWMDFPEARSQVKNFLAHVCHMEMYLQGPSRWPALFFLEGGVGEVDGWRTNQLTNQPTPPNVPPVWNKSLIRPYKRKPMVNEPLIKPGFISWALGVRLGTGWLTSHGSRKIWRDFRNQVDVFAGLILQVHESTSQTSILKCCVHSEPCQIDDDMELPYIPFRKMLGSKRLLMTIFCSPLSQRSSHSNKHLPYCNEKVN